MISNGLIKNCVQIYSVYVDTISVIVCFHWNERLENKLPILGPGKGDGLDVETKSLLVYLGAWFGVSLQRR